MCCIMNQGGDKGHIAHNLVDVGHIVQGEEGASAKVPKLGDAVAQHEAKE